LTAPTTKVRFGGEIKDFNAAEYTNITAKDLKRVDRFVQFGLVGAHIAYRQAQLEDFDGDPYRRGVLVGSGIGGLNEIESQHDRLYNQGPARVSPFMIPKLMVNAASGNISVTYGLKGPNSAVATACASATNAIGDAFKLIQHDIADIMVTGGSEAAVTPMGLSGFARMNALSTRNDDPQSASRPFDRDRDGLSWLKVPGLLCSKNMNTPKRGVPILAEVTGYGMSADGTHMTAPDPEGRGAARAMQHAIKDAGLNPEDIDYINTHGTSTPLGDVAETAAINSVFASRVKKMPVSSTKGHLGHLLGASGGVEFVVAVDDAAAVDDADAAAVLHR